ncbi:MAG TPA: cache domain-containing protein, partial [Gammaproteobacteria bacterium]|nr:cache domain-containing protein [Gammaproteobacteria bacterium]
MGGWFRFQSVGAKFLMFLLPIIILAGVVNAIWAYQRSRWETERQVTESFATFRRELKENLANQADDLALATQVMKANLPAVQALARGDRERLAKLTVPLFNKHLKGAHHIRFFQFHTPPATSFLRVNLPEDYGQDLSGWRHMVVDANRERQTEKGLEVVRFGLALVAVSPISYQGKHIGSVEFGRSAQALFAQVAKHLGLQYATGIKQQIFTRAHRLKTRKKDQKRDGLIFYTYSSSRAEHLLEQVPGSGLGRTIHRQGRVYATRSFPLRDYSGKEVARVALFKDITASRAGATRGLLVQLGLIAAASLAILAVLRILAGRLVSRPLGEMGGKLTDIAAGEGDLTQRLRVRTRDEIGRISYAFNQLMDKLQGQMRSSREQSTQLATASEELTASAQGLQEGARDQMRQVEQVNESTREVNRVVQEVASNISEVSGSAGAVNREARGGREAAERASQQMTELSQTTENVNRITETIQTIAKKTDLLAL